MNCSNCGNRLIPGDTFCPACGARVPETRQPARHQSAALDTQARVSQQAPDKRKKNNGPWIIALAVIVACALVGGALYLGISHQDEETQWALCQQTNDINDLLQYIDKFPDGEHIAQARELYSRLINEKTAWEQVVAAGDEDALRAFINNHPSSKYLLQAHDMLDDVVWNNALAKNTKEAFNNYVREFPSGRHIGEARSHFDELQRAELTLDERERVRQSVQQFLQGLEQWDAAMMMATCNANMDNFMGKSPATMNDVRDYFDAYRESDIDSIGFSSLAVDVSKEMLTGSTPQYTARFTVTRRFSRANPENGTVALMRGDAVVDNYFRFNSFNMNKVSER